MKSTHKTTSHTSGISTSESDFDLQSAKCARHLPKNLLGFKLLIFYFMTV